MGVRAFVVKCRGGGGGGGGGVVNSVVATVVVATVVAAVVVATVVATVFVDIIRPSAAADGGGLVALFNQAWLCKAASHE